VNEEALAQWGLSRQKTKNIQDKKMYHKKFFNIGMSIYVFGTARIVSSKAVDIKVSSGLFLKKRKYRFGHLSSPSVYQQLSYP
jgi:hypothetical protein